MKIEVLSAWQLSDSPAHNNEAEVMMGKIIRVSAEAEEWIPIPVADLDGLFRGAVQGNLEPPLQEGLINLKISGLVTVEEVEGIRSVVVTERFKAFYEKASQKKLS
jgi:hypothetical protein